jgi:spermidine/putrescine transport system ATP-binding protein
MVVHSRPIGNIDMRQAQPATGSLGKRQAPLLRLKGIAKDFANLPAVHPLDVDIERGDFVAVLGPSGCGKTTLLRMIGGFVKPSTGVIEIDGADVTSLAPEHRPTNMVFQGYGLFPHMNVAQNIGYGLKLRNTARSEIEARVGDAMRLVQLTELARRSVDQLSGGQQQRVALARALIMRPKLLLLDEPLAALDLKLRHAMQEELRRIHQDTGGTFVVVTHDQSEAMAMANRIAVMREGHMEQVGSPRELYDQPATRFVATFLGEANLFEGERHHGEVRLKQGGRFASPGPDGPICGVVRPDNLFVIKGKPQPAQILLRGKVKDQVFAGPITKLRIVDDESREFLLHLPAADDPPSKTQEIRFGFQPQSCRIIAN